jgi:hypothetical protein
MSRAIIAILSICLLVELSSCREKQKSKQEEYIDVAAYLRGQLKYLDSVPHGYLKLTTADTLQPDSVYLTLQQVKDLVLGFIAPELEKDKFSERFEETSFADATLQTITITYRSVSPKNAVERIDVYVNPENGSIHRLYLVQAASSNEHTAKRQLLWTHNQGFTIITTHSREGQQTGSSLTEQVIWQ